MAVHGYDPYSVNHQPHRFGFQYPGNRTVTDEQQNHQSRKSINNQQQDKMSNPKSGMSRLEQLRMGYQERLLHEKEQKLNQFYETQTSNALNRKIRKSKSGGAVREFFAERRALENTEFARKNPEHLPPIQHHFNKVKQQKQPSYDRHFENRAAFARAAPGRSEIKSVSAPARPRGHVYQRPKPCAGIDRQNPLPSLRPVNKQQESVYSHYETESNLTKNGEEINIEKTISPHPPTYKKKPLTKRPQRPISRTPSNGSVDDVQLDMGDAMPPPNLSRLKQLRAKRLSQTKLPPSGNISPKETKQQKLSDFEKWQMEQDEERAQRLENHKKKTESESPDGVLSISYQERELLEKIKNEKEKLDQIQRDKDKLEEEQRREKEEEQKWLAYQKELDEQAEKMEREKEKMEREKKRKEEIAKSKKLKSLQEKKHTVKSEPPIVKNENIYNTGDGDDAVDYEQEQYFKSFYEQKAITAPTADEEQVDLSPCSLCGRNFATERLAKHQTICAKAAAAKKKRKVFDQKKMRMQGTEMEQYIGKKDLGEPTKPVKKSNWRAQHENFIHSIRYAKGASDEPPPAAENPDYVQCPHCSRKFNSAAADRHIPRCKDTKAKPTFLKRKK